MNAESIIQESRIIDFHTHTFPDAVAAEAIPKLEKVLEKGCGCEVRARLSGTRAALSASTKLNGLALSVVVPVATSPRQTDSINRFAIKNNETTSESRLLSFGAVHPDNENYREILKGLRAAGIKGIKLHPDYQGVCFDDIRYLRILDCASELDLIVVTHAGVDPGFPDKVHCTPDMAVRALEQVRPRKLVLAHMGGLWMWDEVEARLIGRDVYLDTANSFEPYIGHLDGKAFRRMVAAHGADRILYATDSPWADQGENIARIRKMIPEEDIRRKILGENAAGLLGL